MSIVAPVNQGKATGAAVGSLAIITAADIAQGDLIAVFHNSAQTAGTVQSITDPATSPYSQGAQVATNPNCAIYYGIAAAFIPAGSTITVVFNGGAGNRHGIVVWSAACGGGTWALDVVATPPTTGTAIASGTLTFPAQAQAIELLVAMVGSGNSNPGAVAWDQGFTGLNNTGSVDFLFPAYLISAAASGNTVTPSWVNSVLYRTIAVAFQLTPAAVVTPPSDPTPFTGGGSGMRAPRRYIQSSPKPTGPSAAEKQKALTAALRKLTKPRTAPIVVGLESTPEIPFFDDAPPVAGLFTPVIGPQAITLVTDRPLVLPAPEPVKPQKPKPEPDEDDEEVLALVGI